MADPRVTVIPVTNSALQAVITPYVAFEHQFKDRPGRLERQADILDNVGSQAACVMGDVWPAGQMKPYSRRRMATFVREFALFTPAFCTHLWPEGILYRTDVLQHCKLNELATYRPAVEPWTRLKMDLRRCLNARTVFVQEPMIAVPSRMLYPHEFKGPPITMPDANVPITVIAIAKNKEVNAVMLYEEIDQQTISKECQVIVVSESSQQTEAAMLNEALTKARGQRIALWDVSCQYAQDRLERQLMAPAHIVGSPVANRAGTEDYDIIPFGHTNFSGLAYTPQETMMIDRVVFEQLGGFDPALPVEYGFDLQLRAFGQPDITLAQVTEPLAARRADAVDSAEARFGLYCVFVKRDLTLHHFNRDGAHKWISFAARSA